jgi:uncharacterized protein YndB with AHSA1/START domain
MASTTIGPGERLQVRRMFAAPRPKVFEAWTEREKLEKWMCRDNPNNVARYTAFDMRLGGTNMMEIRAANGATYHQRVTFREIKPPEKLVFTWGWERFNPSGVKDEVQEETLVTVDFEERGKFTEVTLTHEHFRTAEQCERHQKGWIGCFDRLTEALGA